VFGERRLRTCGQSAMAARSCITTDRLGRRARLERCSDCTTCGARRRRMCGQLATRARCCISTQDHGPSFPRPRPGDSVLCGVRRRLMCGPGRARGGCIITMAARGPRLAAHSAERAARSWKAFGALPHPTSGVWRASGCRTAGRSATELETRDCAIRRRSLLNHV
jgi:hypothetical protein